MAISEFSNVSFLAIKRLRCDFSQKWHQNPKFSDFFQKVGIYIRKLHLSNMHSKFKVDILICEAKWSQYVHKLMTSHFELTICMSPKNIVLFLKTVVSNTLISILLFRRCCDECRCIFSYLKLTKNGTFWNGRLLVDLAWRHNIVAAAGSDWSR